MPKIVYDESNTIFSLDIGTRTVIGILVNIQEKGLKILAQCMVEHKSRAMLDGQIHDIPRVAEAVKKVKAELEKKVKFPLTKVAIAAAGRSLKTCSCQVEQELVEDLEIDQIMINTLELLGVQKAQKNLEESSAQCGGKENFYCVGYSVVGYYLNDYLIANLEGHRAKKIGTKVLATFLPASVVNSLQAVLARVGLESVNLTLEPIAACEAIIPEQLRLLNLALVDVGAGTSDIAISRDGTITAYGMVPTAGDEITEILMETLMVDFMTAEDIKRSLNRNKDIIYKDALGINASISCQDVMQIIEPAVELLAEEIAANIVQLNGNIPPKSVMCVGGGSQVLTLTDRIATKLGLISQRVVLRNRDNIGQLLELKKKDLAGPEGVTVVGIALVAAKKLGQNFISVTVNGKPFTLFNTRQMSVLQALGVLNYNPRELLGLNGKDLHFTLNGESKTLYGELAKPALIRVNGKQAHLQTVVKNGDIILVDKAVNGENAVARVKDLAKDYLKASNKIYLLNGQSVSPEAPISDGDELYITDMTKEAQNEEDHALPFSSSTSSPSPASLESSKLSGTDISITVNGQPIVMKGKKEYILIDIFNYYELNIAETTGMVAIKRNGNSVEYTDILTDGDVIEISW